MQMPKNTIVLYGSRISLFFLEKKLSRPQNRVFS